MSGRNRTEPGRGGCPSRQRPAIASMRPCIILAAIGAIAAAQEKEARPWLAGFERTFPCDVLFVKGKKVAGTTLGGVVRRIGKRHGVDFFAPTMPSQVPRDWRSGGRERWVLEEFGRFLTRSKGLVGWGQEQTLSPRKKGLAESSGPLQELAAKALRLTAVRDPVKHAISACTHFGPCGRRSSGGSAYNATSEARLSWVSNDMGTGQMSRFVAHEPDSSQSPADFYHAIFVTDRLDESLVALALSLKLDLEDVLYVSAKTSHTQRRPKTEALDRDFKQGLRRAFYGDQYTNSEPPLPLPRSKRPADFSPDAALYHDAVARLDATIASLPTFEVHLRRFRKMQGRLVEACARGGARRARLGRDAGACLYGDQGCGYRCIDEWAAAPRGAAGPREQPLRRPRAGNGAGGGSTGARQPVRRPRAGNGARGGRPRGGQPVHRPGTRNGARRGTRRHRRDVAPRALPPRRRNRGLACCHERVRLPSRGGIPTCCPGGAGGGRRERPAEPARQVPAVGVVVQ